MAAIDTAIEAADDAIKAAKESAENTDLAADYNAVIVDKKKPKTAAYHGVQVAEAIGGSLGPTGTVAHDITNAAPTTIPADNMSAVMMDDATGMTWAQIVGEDNVMMSRLGTDNTAVMIASIAGMTAADVHEALVTTGTYGDGSNQADSSYKGIPGTAHCLGTDCKVETVDGTNKLTGSWYFESTSPKAYYEKVGEATTYAAEANYARFGHWLIVNGVGVATVNTYAWSNGGTDVNLDENAELDGSATYTGTAAGMSLHKTFDSQGERQDVYSGRFTADVSLTADFDASPTVKGTIDNFKGPATDSSWSVELKQMTLGTARQGTVGETATGGSGDDGEWNAQAYGVAAKRPTGIFGDFNAHWTDGHAAGAYATRQE